jgi:hypothetical protein
MTELAAQSVTGLSFNLLDLSRSVLGPILRNVP